MTLKARLKKHTKIDTLLFQRTINFEKNEKEKNEKEKNEKEKNENILRC
jgi:hypothetical protein